MEAIVLDEGGRSVKRQEIFNYYQRHKDNAERIQYLKDAYTDASVEIVKDGVRVGYHKQDDGLLMWEGSYHARTSESVFSWGVVTEMTESLMERGEYQIRLGLQNAPVMAEQLTLFDMGGSAPVFEVDDDQASMPLFPMRDVPQAVIDQALYTAGNESGSAYRVSAFYMREHPEPESADFLCREFGAENGRGIEYEGRKYAIWFAENGIQLAEGNSVRTGHSRTTATWEQASARILELLNAGTYLSPAELEQAWDKTLNNMAIALIYTARDLSEAGRSQGFLQKTCAVYDQVLIFPDCANALAEQAQDETFLTELSQEYHTFLTAYADDHRIMRSRMSSYNTHRIESVLDGVAYPKRSFTAQPDFLRQCKMFITEDEIDQYFLGGSVDSRLSVYSHFCYPHTPKEHQDFIKSYYGEYSGSGRNGYNSVQTHKGLTYQRGYGSMKYDTVQLTVPNVVAMPFLPAKPAWANPPL